MKKNPMTLERFGELLDAYGAAPARWPEAQRAAALRLLESEPRARELQRAALELDAALDAFAVPDPSAQLKARVLEIPIRHAAAAPARARWLGWRLLALALIPCALGFLSGTMTSDPTASDSLDDGWSEVASVTLLGDLPDEDWP